MTCLFWFESLATLEEADNPQRKPVSRLTEFATPLPAFKKWVYSVVGTTQVTENVILLALLFVYRLKTANPNVKGGSGSEYRLLTVALMLGNKCKSSLWRGSKILMLTTSSPGRQHLHEQDVG
jgi:hypothetical protein